MIFVNSMSDLFHEDIPLDYISEVFAVMDAADGTPSRSSLSVTNASPSWHPNSTGPRTFGWGSSIENRRFVERADYLREVPAAVRFISAEPCWPTRRA